MAWTQSDLDKLDAAIAAGNGVRTITFDNQTLAFHDLDQMLRLRAQMQSSVAAAAGTPRMRFAVTSKGA
jgi:hypothetical protein